MTRKVSESRRTFPMKDMIIAIESRFPANIINNGTAMPHIEKIEFATSANQPGPTPSTYSPSAQPYAMSKCPPGEGRNVAKTEGKRIKSEISQSMRSALAVVFGLLVLFVSGGECCDRGCDGTSDDDHGAAVATNGTVWYDHRALLIDGQRRFLISGSIHYPRSTPQMWPELVNLAKEGGLDVIQTYVFWDGHEQQRGKYYFGGRYDLVRFLKVVQRAGLYVNLRIGPYISAEWNFGGFPEWLREIPGIEFRTNNKAFKAEMERFVSYIVGKMKRHQLFYSQGGPVILSQVENEYGSIEAAYKDAGVEYMEWAGAMAVNLNTSVPWIMCKQTNAPGSIIDTCNGFYCDDYIPNAPDKPKMWTENWSGWFHSWGMPLYHRPVEDLAYATARFFQKGGSFMNYYMYHGGTNFGRTSAAGITTSYDYDAPIDEYGQVRQPKWGHLKALHAAIKLCEPALAIVDGEPRHWSIAGWGVEIHVYSNSTEEDPAAFEASLAKDRTVLCSSFISNSAMTDVSVDFAGKSYDLPAWSVSILPDCKNVIYNTAKVAAQTSVNRIMKTPADDSESAVPLRKKSVTETRSAWSRDRGSSISELEVFEDSDFSGNSSVSDSKPLRCQFARDVVGVWGKGIVHQGLLEQINLTHDMTDYLWYTTTVNIPQNSNLSHKHEAGGNDASSWLIIETVRTIVYVFLNGELAGGYPVWKGTTMYHPLALKPGNNSIALLSSLPGLWYAGPFYDKEVGGLSGSVTLQGVPYVRDINLTQFEWIHQVGLKGEKHHLDNGSDVGVRKLNWSSEPPPAYQPLVWYRIRLSTPRGQSPVVLDMGSMGKGAIWVNGHHMGRYWVVINNPLSDCHKDCDYRGIYEAEKKCHLECGQTSQRWYHVPREWLQPEGENVLIILEEIGGNATRVAFSTQVVSSVCARVSESDPPSSPHPTSDASLENFPELQLDCGLEHLITNVEFASFGDPSGRCGQFTTGECHAPRSREVLQESCEGRHVCTVQVQQSSFGDDPCPGKVKSLAVQAVCEFSGSE